MKFLRLRIPAEHHARRKCRPDNRLSYPHCLMIVETSENVKYSSIKNHIFIQKFIQN